MSSKTPKTMTVSEIMAIRLVGVKTTCAATITDTKTGGQFAGTLEYDWAKRTVGDALKFATSDRRIASAPAIRRNIGSYRSTKNIALNVAAPGVRDAATRIISVDAVETFLKTVSADVMDAMVARVMATREPVTPDDVDTDDDA